MMGQASVRDFLFLAAARGTFGFAIGGLVVRGGGYPTRRLDVVFSCPGQALCHVHAAAIVPTLLGAIATAVVMLAGEWHGMVD